MAVVEQVRLTPDQEAKLISWIEEKLERIHANREARETNWRRWREQYEGPVPGIKEFPWRGASNVHVPLTSIITDAVHANIMNRVYSQDSVYDVKAGQIGSTQVGMNPEDGQPITISDLASKSQDYLNHIADDPVGMNLYSVFEQATLEATKLGTSIIHNPWVTLTQPDFKLDPDTGEVLRGEETIVYDGIRPRLIPLEDFVILPGYAEVSGPEGSPLVGHRYWLRSGEVLARRDWYRRSAMDQILVTPGGEEDTIKDAQELREGGSASYSTEVRGEDHELYDLWIRYPLYENKPEVSLFVTFSKQARALPRIQPFLYRSIPYTPMRYVRRENRFYGIGIPEMVESLQKGINTSFNQSVDNATIANMRCFKVKSGTKAARLFGDIYPGKRFIVDDADDIEPFQLGEIYPSIFQVGLLLRDFAERRTGITDFNLGRESDVLGRSAPAAGINALLQESSRRFDLYARDIRRAMGEVGAQILELTQQHKPADQIYEVMGEDGQLVERILLLPSEINLRQFLVVNASSIAASNKEISRQNSITSFGIVTQYLERLFQLATLMVNPQAPPPLKQLAYQMSQTAERLMQRILNDFDQHDIAAYLPQMEGLLNAGGQAPGADALLGVGGVPGAPMGLQGGPESAAPSNGGGGGDAPF